MTDGTDVLKALLLIFVAVAMIAEFVKALPWYAIALAAIGGIAVVARTIWDAETS